MTFENKTFIVTGAGGGMGEETVKLLLDSGANVAGCDLHTDNLSKYKNTNKFIAFKGDLLDEDIVKDIFKETANQFGNIDGLVNIAGIAQSSTPIDEVSLDEWRRIMDINVTMMFLTCREASVYMKEKKQGSMINIGSVSATRPRPGLQSYVASKGAVEAFSKAMALELAPYQINVNVLHPGPSDTAMLGQFSAESASVDQTKKEIFEKSVPLGSLLKPENIAHSIKYLLSDEAKMVTGAVLHVDGGRNI
ncbi:SDR family NAD(P)-dependent oxidoreductase [Oceanobacillus timonensis]|uniref:SDR family NAD(P)-dependent oxidoreductase n=1 Tax=Oceanobacillus timonensis TaxID=1926285 RepID=UPI0009BBB26F|nr:SDR family oxidoreductase [Oceanobacillus timonensis]